MDDLYQTPMGQTFHSHVLVPALQNLLASVGASLAVWLALYWWWPEMKNSDELAWTAGGVVFALASVVRGFRDEAALLLATWREKRNSVELDALKDQINALRQENAELHERIQKGQYSVDSGAEVNRAAVLILNDYYRAERTATAMEKQGDAAKAGAVRQRYATTFRACEARGVCNRPTWEAATNQLVAARILSNTKRAVLVQDGARALAALAVHQTASKQAIVSADGSLVAK